MHFSLYIPLNGGRTGVINLQHPGDESSVKERERGKRQRERQRMVAGECNLELKKRASCFCIDQADDSRLVNVMAKPSW